MGLYWECDVIEDLGYPEYEIGPNGNPVFYDYSAGCEIFCAMFLSNVMQRCPVDTGYLLYSINAKPARTSMRCWTKCSYAQYQEYGTVYMRAQPYFQPSLYAAFDIAVMVWEEEFDNVQNYIEGNINSEDLEEYCVSNTLDSAYCIPAIALGRVVGNKPVEITNADIKMIKDIGYDGLVIYILTNKRNEVGMYLLDLYKDIMYDEISLEIESSSDKTDNDIIKEISEKVSARDLKKIYEERKKTINTKNDNDVKIEIRGNTTTSNNSTKTTKTENKEEYIPSELVEKSPSFLDLIVSKLTVNNKEGEAQCQILRIKKLFFQKIQLDF